MTTITVKHFYQDFFLPHRFHSYHMTHAMSLVWFIKFGLYNNLFPYAVRNNEMCKMRGLAFG